MLVRYPSVRRRVLAAFAFLGVPVAANAQDNAWQLVDEFRFDGSSELPLGSIDQLVPGPDGSVFVAGQGHVAIHVLSRDGQYERAMGREGDGPGEFRTTPQIGLLADTLWALDRRLRRVSQFGLSGDLVGGRQLRAVQSNKGFLLNPTALLANGTALLMESVGTHWSAEYLSEGAEVRLLSIDDGNSDDILRLAVSTVWLRLSLSNETIAATVQPWSVHDLLAVSPRGDGFVVVSGRGTENESGRYTLTWFDVDGGPTRSAFVSFDGVELAQTVIDSLREGLAEGLAEQMRLDLRSMRRALSETLYTPQFLPGVEAVTRSASGGAAIVAMDGTTWVRHRDVAGTRWLVFDRSGERIAEVEAPNDLVIHHVGVEHVWGVREDALGIPLVYRYRLQKERQPGLR